VSGYPVYGFFHRFWLYGPASESAVGFIKSQSQPILSSRKFSRYGGGNCRVAPSVSALSHCDIFTRLEPAMPRSWRASIKQATKRLETLWNHSENVIKRDLSLLAGARVTVCPGRRARLEEPVPPGLRRMKQGRRSCLFLKTICWNTLILA
jgi:hypothetical protein